MRRLKKIFLWLLAITAGLLILAIIGLKLFFPVDKARRMAIEKGSAALGRPLSVGEIEISVWGGLGLRLVDIKIDNPDSLEGMPLLTAEAFDLKLRLLPLISGEVRIDKLIIDKPEIILFVNDEGRNNFTFKTSQLDSANVPEKIKRDLPDEVNIATAAISFDKFEINDGHLTYSDKITGNQLTIAGLQLESSLETPRSDLYRGKGSLFLDSLSGSLIGKYPLLAAGINYSAEYDLTRQLVTIARAKASMGDVSIILSGDLGLPIEEMTAKLNLKSEGIDISSMMALLPPDKKEMLSDLTVSGSLNFDIDLFSETIEDASDWQYSGTAEILDLSGRWTDVDADLKLNRALVDVKQDNLRMTIEEGSFDSRPLKGHVIITDFSNPNLAGELAGQIDLAFIQSFIPVQGTHQLGGLAHLDLKFSGAAGNIKEADFSGTLRVSDGKYESDILPEPVDSFACDMYLDRSTLNVRQLALHFKSGQVLFSGRVNDFVPWLLSDSSAKENYQPEIDGSFEGTLDLAAIEPFLPDRGNPELSGHLKVDLKVVGTLTDLQGIRPRGTLTISDATYSDSLLPEPVTSFSVETKVTPDSISVNYMKASFTSSDLRFSGTVLHPFPTLLPFELNEKSAVKKPLFMFELSSHRFDVDKLFPEAVPASGAVQTGQSPDSVSMVLLPDIEGRGKFNIDTLIYSQVTFYDLNGKLLIQDRRMQFLDVTSDVYGGAVSGKTTIDLHDLNEPHYIGEFEGNRIDADQFMARFTSFGGYLEGKIDVAGSYDAKGWEPEDFLNSLNVNGNGSLNDGMLTTSGAMYGLMSQLAEKTGQTFSKKQKLKNMTSGYTVKDGGVSMDDLSASLGNIGDLEIGGYYGFDSTISYNGTIKLSPELSKKLLSSLGGSGILGNLFSSGKNQRVSLPFVIGGTLDNPKPNIDYSALGKTLGSNLKDKAGNSLLDLFRKKKDN